MIEIKAEIDQLFEKILESKDGEKVEIETGKNMKFQIQTLVKLVEMVNTVGAPEFAKIYKAKVKENG